MSKWHPHSFQQKKETEMNAIAMSSSILIPHPISSNDKGYLRQILGLAPVEIDPNYLCSFCKDLLVQKFFVLLIVCNKTFSATYILISNALQISINSQPCDLQKIILEPKIFLLHQLRLHNAIVAIND